MNNYSTEQLQKIVESQPDATDYDFESELYWKFPPNAMLQKSSFDCSWRQVFGDLNKDFKPVPKLTKLSDIRAELESRMAKFKVGDLVIESENKITPYPFKLLEIEQDGNVYGKDTHGNSRHSHVNRLRIAVSVRLRGSSNITAQLDPAKCRGVDPTLYDAPLTDRKILVDAAIHNALHGLSSTPKIDCNHTPFNFGLADAQGNRDCITCGKRFTRHEVDAAWLTLARNAPTDSPRDDFDAMSEIHRSPSCKCHEFPFDAELEVPAGLIPDDILITTFAPLEQLIPDSIEKTLAERGARYGEFPEHARITQNIKRAMADSPNWYALADDQKETLEMLAHKIGRILNGDPDYHDSWHDIVGYTKLVADRLEGEQGE